MTKPVLLLILFFIRTESFNIETYIDSWCKEPLKIIDFQQPFTEKNFGEQIKYKCSIWLRHIPNKNWTKQQTELFITNSTSELSILKISDGLTDFDENFFNLALRLRYLDMSGNHLNFLPFPQLKSTQSISYVTGIFNFLLGLDLSHNNFTNFIKAKAAFLEDLDLSNNQLTEVPISSLVHFPLLNKLILKKNNITKFEKRQFSLPSLEHLDISSNYLKDLNGLENFVHLRTLLLSYNDFPIIDSNLFRVEMWSIKELHLDHDEIREITSDAFKHLPNLQKLKLAHNRITKLDKEVFSSLKRLESLDISNNFLTVIGVYLFASQKKLTELNFRSNNIEKFDYISMMSQSPSLKDVDLLGNPFYCDDLEKMMIFFEERLIDIKGEKMCFLDETISENCCKTRITTSSTQISELSKKTSTQKTDTLQWVINQTSHNVSEYITFMEKKSEDFFQLMIYQFGFIVTMSAMFLIVYTCRHCGRKNAASKNLQLEGEKMI